MNMFTYTILVYVIWTINTCMYMSKFFYFWQLGTWCRPTLTRWPLKGVEPHSLHGFEHVSILWPLALQFEHSTAWCLGMTILASIKCSRRFSFSVSHICEHNSDCCRLGCLLNWSYWCAGVLQSQLKYDLPRNTVSHICEHNSDCCRLGCKHVE